MTPAIGDRVTVVGTVVHVVGDTVYITTDRTAKRRVPILADVLSSAETTDGGTA